MEGTIKVTPQELKSTASEFASHGAAIQELMAEMMSKVTSLRSYWEGDAAEAYINKFTQLQDDINLMIGMCTEHSEDLEEMADIYLQYDQQAEELTGGLATVVIV